MKMTLSLDSGSGKVLRMIEIIKQIRTITHLGLKESKEIADAVRDGMRQVIEPALSYKSDRDPELQKACFALRDLGFNIEYECDLEQSKAQKAIKEHIKAILSLCVDQDESELLEVMSVAFKMVCEKQK